jgi:tetratricopeptide (TPR) repeat protein
MWWILALCFLQTADHNSEGMKALDSRNYEAAAAEFRKAIEADSQDYSAHFNLALADSFLRRDEEGIAEYRKALEIKPHLYEAELNAGILLLRQKDAAGAAPLLSDAASQKPKEFRPLYYLAESQLALGQAAEAQASYTQALEIDPKSAASELGLARAMARQDKLDEAAPHYRQAAALDPRNREWLLELAGFYEKDKKIEEALAIYREFPENAGAQERAGELALDRKQYTDAIPPLEAAYSREPSQANRVGLAMAYLFAGQLPKALPLMQQAAAVEPANFDVLMMYGRALRDSRQYPAAAAEFAAAVKLKPADAPAWSDLGGVLYLTGHWDDSLAAFQKARALGQDTPGNCFLRAIILDKLRQLKPALEAYQLFLAMSHGKNPDQEFQARQRSRILRSELEKR